MLNSFFKLEANNTSVKKEIFAGLTTFSAMAYCLVVAPAIFAEAGMPKDAQITAIILTAIIGTLVMALYAKLPIVLAPGVGMSAFFAYTIVLKMGLSWQYALTAVFLEGIIFILLTLFNVREAIINTIPSNLKYAISVGIGLFITFIGLENAGIIQSGIHLNELNQLTGSPVEIGNLKSPQVIISLTGLLVTVVLMARKFNASLLVGITISTCVALFLGVAHLPEHYISKPPSIAPTFMQLELQKIFSIDMLKVLFVLLMVNLFDTAGTLIGLCDKAGLLDKNGRIPRAKQALMADSIGTTVGALMGTGVVVGYLESASGIAAGGKTGLTALTAAGMFVLALFFSPVFTMIPAAATAPALIIIGLLMISSVKEIDFTDMTEALPAFLTIVIMPFSYSIAEGVVFGILSYIAMKLFTGRYREVSYLMYIIGLFFIVKIIFFT